MAPEWTNWEGWKWIAMAITFAEGWIFRGMYERAKMRRKKIEALIKESTKN